MMNDSITTDTTLSSFAQMFGRPIEGQTIQKIEIPLIQRDYAQGRKTENVNRIREKFINTLCDALLPGRSPVDLDFVFGDVDKNGNFHPLDGQQRLTTLFLLHCYLAWRVEESLEGKPWIEFSYDTRPGAREFCKFLARRRPDFSSSLSVWIKDHADFLSTWKYDPSIQSMLVVLDAIHDWFTEKQPDLQSAWGRLLDEESPAITFHVLPMEANGLTNTLYIKMNSRGKPLTPFENFKAYFEDVLRETNSEYAADFAKKVDTVWSDILWPYRGDDNLIDDEFMRYFRFITEICAWKDELVFNDKEHIESLSARVFGAETASAVANVEFLIQAFDIWENKAEDQFNHILTSQRNDLDTSLLIFNTFDKEGVNLFHACCRHYGKARQWSLAHSLFLYGVLQGLIYQVSEADFIKRLRTLRNLIEASNDEIRVGERNNMPKLLDEVKHILIEGNLQEVRTFNQVQVENEKAKLLMLLDDPSLEKDLYRLEDHDHLRGGLTAFNIESDQFSQRSQAFITIFNKGSASSENLSWKPLTGALLAKGDYSRCSHRWTGHRFADFGSPKNDEPWRDLFRGRKVELEHPVLKPLTVLLDAVVNGELLQDIIDGYLNNANTEKDWRYYFVKYGAMREGESGRYTISNNGGGYQVCMLKKSVMRSNYYDPYLLAMVRKSNVGNDRIGNVGWPCCFFGYETVPRVLILKDSGIELQCVNEGWKIGLIPTDAGKKAALDLVCSTLGVGKDFICKVKQDGNGIDIEDRIELGAKLLSDLVRKGL